MMETLPETPEVHNEDNNPEQNPKLHFLSFYTNVRVELSIPV